MKFLTRGPDETLALGRHIGQLLKGGDLIGLFGELGTGKTVLVRGIAEGMGLSSRQVASPTFILLREYSGPVSLYHVDLYRVSGADALHDLDLEELVDNRHVVVVEWAERLRAKPGWLTLSITLKHQGLKEREMIVEGHGNRGEGVVQSLSAPLGKSCHAG